MDGSTYNLNDPLSEAAGGLTPNLLGSPLADHVYAWGAGQTVTVYGPQNDILTIDWIESVHRYLYDSGLPVPALYERVKLPQGVGLVYEQVLGQTIADHLLHAPAITDDQAQRLARIFAQAHLRIHSQRYVPAVPVAPRKFAPMIESQRVIPSCEREALLSRLMAMSRLPFLGGGLAGHRSRDYRACLCHGDFHMGNLILSARGPVATDWMNCHLGDPLEDVACTIVLLQGLVLEMPEPNEGPLRLFVDSYVEHYVELFGDKYAIAARLARRRIDAWRPIVCAIRLSDNIPALCPWLLDEIERTL